MRQPEPRARAPRAPRAPPPRPRRSRIALPRPSTTPYSPLSAPTYENHNKSRGLSFQGAAGWHVYYCTLRPLESPLAQQLKLEDPHRCGVVGMEPVARAGARAATAHGDGGRAVG